MMGVVPAHSEEGALDWVLEQTRRRQGGIYLGCFVPWFENNCGKKKTNKQKKRLVTICFTIT